MPSLVSPSQSATEPGDKEDSAVFVTASDAKQIDAVISLIGSIKHRFGTKQRIIVYDLGGILLNAKMVVEYRRFNLNQLPPNLRNIKTFAWKIFILAQSHLEFNTFIYVDTSVRIYNGDFERHIYGINKRILSPFLFNMGTNHGIKRATLPETFQYLPLYTSDEFDIEMQETHFIIVQKSEFSKEILKWAILCALTKECFEPKNNTKCEKNQLYIKDDNLFGICHKNDKSVLTILINNAEEEIISKGNSNLILHSSYNHHSRRLSIFPFTNYQILKDHRDNPEEVLKRHKC
uniref:Uncharacterized protein n=1 Tax=Meloidogyne javanica TaxID=6303 RepID=A0A915ND58_MELJA